MANAFSLQIFNTSEYCAPMTLYTKSNMTLAGKIKLSLSCTLLFSAALLSGCGSTPTKDDSAAIETQELRDHTAIIEQALNSESPLKDQYLLTAADILANKGDTDWARNLLGSIEHEQLGDSDFQYYTSLYSQLALLDDAYFLAQRILTEPRLEQQWQQLDTEQSIELRERRAQVFIILGEIDLSVQERLTLETLLQDDAELETNQNSIWQALMTLPSTELRARAEQETNTELKAWYQLASLNKNNQGDLGQQQRQIERWMRSWPQHPASIKLPKDLELIEQLIQNNPQQVALLLPLSGKLGKAGTAIRDGFFSAYYQAMSEGSWTPSVRIYDTQSNAGNIDALYVRAVTEGAQMVVGPLDKEAVAKLNQQKELPTPILSLNYIEAQPSLDEELLADDEESIDDGTSLASNTDRESDTPNSESVVTVRPELFQFGLAIEDEAVQTADRAWLEGHRRAMIITPDASWGERSADAFTKQWLALGGEITGINRFNGNNDYSRVIAGALQVDQSKLRARELRGVLGHGFEFEPRRRQDLDVIFLTARPGQARQIMPTLAFHYAGKVPVFATSHIYSGFEDRKSDRDLNNIKFSSSPWIFDQNSAEKKAIDTYRPSTANYGRLYALGVDAYHLYPRLTQLQSVPNTRFYGATGALRLLPNQRIRREQMWAQIRGGRAIAMPTVVENTH